MADPPAASVGAIANLGQGNVIPLGSASAAATTVAAPPPAPTADQSSDQPTTDGNIVVGDAEG